MSEETQFIIGDAAVDAGTQGRRGLRRRRKRRAERVLTNCENCGAPLSGEYCAQCGQHAVDYRRSLWRVLIDAADSFLNWDTKFLSSVGVLLLKPWRLTNDFNAGRRARYVHPLRLYLLASIAFFLMLKVINFNSTDLVQFDEKDRAEIAAALGKLTGADSTLTPEQQATVESVRSRIQASNGMLSAEEKKDLQKVFQAALATKMKEKFERGERARVKAALKRIPQIPNPDDIGNTGKEIGEQVRKQVAAEIAAEHGAASPSAFAAPGALALPVVDAPAALPTASATRQHEPGLHFGSEPGKPQTPVEAWFQSRIKDKIGEGGTKSKLFLETLRNNIPTMMLCCIPLFALVLKMLYLGRRRYYVEHLVYALHIHTFVYVGATLTTLLALGIAQWSNTARALVSVALSLVMFVQVFLSIRRVYGQGWFVSTLKFVVGGLAYCVILVTAVALTAFVTLLLPG